MGLCSSKVSTVQIPPILTSSEYIDKMNTLPSNNIFNTPNVTPRRQPKRGL